MGHSTVNSSIVYIITLSSLHHHHYFPISWPHHVWFFFFFFIVVIIVRSSSPNVMAAAIGIIRMSTHHHGCFGRNKSHENKLAILIGSQRNEFGNLNRRHGCNIFTVDGSVYMQEDEGEEVCECFVVLGACISQDKSSQVYRHLH
jgi:hypothetical protein